MKKMNESTFKANVEHTWDVYSNENNNYSTIYRAYNKLVDFIKSGLSFGYEWLKDFVIDASQKIKNRIKRISKGHTFYNIHRRANWFYLMYYYDREGNFLCSKVGTTEQTLYKRAYQHEYNGDGTYKDVKTVKIIKGWDCGSVNPKHIEIDMIDYLSKLYPDTHIPNDRFSIRINIEIIEEKINQWLPIYQSIH